MSTLGAGVVTISDVVKEMLPGGGGILPVVELLQQTNAILDDIPWKASNTLNGNITSVRTSLPTVSARVANVGTSATAGKSAQINDACAIFETKSEIDKMVAEVGGQATVAAKRANQARAHIEAIGQKLSTTLFYGALTSPNEFVGLSNRYNALSGTIVNNVIDAGGTGNDAVSIWLVGWAPGKVSGLYPMGTVGGLERDDRGLVDIVDATGIGGATFVGYREYFRWRCGLAVEDWRYVVRIANIDTSDLVAMSSPPDLPEFMIAALETIPNLDGCRPVFYMNRTCKKNLRLLLRNDVQTGGQLDYDVVAGRKVMTFDGVPVRTCDALVAGETVIS